MSTSEPARPEQAPQQLDALTGIRGLAAWLVVFFHIRVTMAGYLPGGVLAVADHFNLAVDLFFILSGFVLWYNYATRLRQGTAQAIADFWWRRVARIWPLHALVLTAFVGFAMAVWLTGRDTGDYPFTQLPLHYLLMQNWGFTPRLTWNDPAWSISAEMGAYILFPLAVRLLRWDHMPSLVLVGAVIVLLGSLGMAALLTGQESLGADVPLLGLRRCLVEFTSGNILCVLWQRWRASTVAAPLSGLAALALLAAGAWTGANDALWAPSMLFTALLALACDKGAVARLLASRPLVWLGEISYSTYLAHFLLFVLFKLAFVGPDLALDWPRLTLYALLVMGASVVLYYGVERPAQAWLNARRPAWLTRRPAAGAA